jgi:hypothetical protein
VEKCRDVFLPLKLNVLSICLVIISRKDAMWHCVPQLSSRVNEVLLRMCYQIPVFTVKLFLLHFEVFIFLAAEECDIE